MDSKKMSITLGGIFLIAIILVFTKLYSIIQETAYRGAIGQVTITDIKVEPLYNRREREAVSFSEFQQKLYSLKWVAYSPTNFDPNKGIPPPEESIREDLLVLRNAGFDGIVTYGTNLLIVKVCEELRLHLIFGIWDPHSQDEISKAKETASSDSVIGFVVGNEGLGVRYNYETLKRVITDLKSSTGKSVTTTEQIEDYADQRLLELGDWVFPNVHAYFHGITDPKEAVAWTEASFKYLTSKTQKPVIFKEVGLPSDGDPKVSEDKEAEYYRQLKATSVKFVWFEAYDQPWKTHAEVEPHWGLFKSDRSPKKVVRYISSQN